MDWLRPETFSTSASEDSRPSLQYISVLSVFAPCFCVLPASEQSLLLLRQLLDTPILLILTDQSTNREGFFEL